MSAKWGILGKSFNDFVEASNKRKIAIDDLFTINGIPLKDAKKQAGSFWSYLYPSKESIKSQLIDVDALYPDISDATASKLLANLQKEQILVNANKKTWQDYFNGLGDGEKWQIEFVQNTDLQKASLNDVKKAYNSAREAAIAHNAALKQQTLGAKAATVATKALAVAGNMIAMWVISKGISLAVTAIDNYIHRIDNLKEAAEEAKSAIDDIKSGFDSLTSTTNDVKERFAELAQNVENLGKVNQSRGTLSTDDYDEFLDSSNQLAELFPQLTKGYDDNGNAILDLSGDVDTIVGSLNNLVSVQQQLTNQEIIDKMPGVWAGYTTDLDEYEQKLNNAQKQKLRYDSLFDAVKSGEAKSFTVRGGSSFGEFADDQQALNNVQELLKKLGLSEQEIKAIQTVESEWRAVTSEFDFDIGRHIRDEVYSYDFSKLTTKQISKIDNAYASLVKEYVDGANYAQQQIESANASVNKYMFTWLSSDWSYIQMDSNMKNAVREMIMNLDLSNLPDKVDTNDWDSVSGYLEENILFAINNIDDISITTALSNLFNLELSPEKVIDLINQIQSYFGEENPISILLQPKLEENRDILDRFNAKNQELGDEEKLNEFFKKHSIDTTEEYENWLTITEGVNIATEAMRAYEKSLETDIFQTFEERWNALSSDFDDAKEKLLDLAKSGEMSSDVITSTEDYKNLIEELGVSADEARTHIVDLIDPIDQLSGANNIMDKIATAYDEWKADGFVSAETLAALPDVVKGLDSFSFFKDIVGTSTSDVAEVQNAFNTLVNEFLQTENILSQVSEDNMQQYIDNLKKMGVANAEEVVKEYSEATDSFKALMQEATKEWESHLKDDAKALQEYLLATDTKNAELMNAFGDEYNIDYQNWVNLLKRKKEAYNTYVAALNNALIQTPDELKSTNKYWAKTDQIRNEAEANAAYAEYVAIGMEMDEIADKYSAKLASTKFSSSSLDFTGSDDSSSDNQFEQQIDHFKNRVEELDEAVSLAKATMENMTSSTGKNLVIDDLVSIDKSKMTDIGKAIDMYQKLADKELAKIPDAFKDLAKNGGIGITDFIGDGNEEVVEAIENYRNWAGEVAALTTQLQELTSELSQLQLDKFNNIAEQYGSQIEMITTSTSQIQDIISLQESYGRNVGEGLYEELIRQTQTQIDYLKREKADLSSQMASAIRNGVKIGSDEWNEMYQAIEDIDSEIIQCTTSVNEFQQSINELKWDTFDSFADKLNTIHDELTSLGDLFRKEELFTDNGDWTNESYAQIGLLAQRYELARYQAEQYRDEIDALNKDYAAGKAGFNEYTERINELNSAQWDNASVIREIEDALSDLYKQRIDKQIEAIEAETDAVRENIEAQKELLQKEKDLQDFRKSIEEKQTDISALQKRINAMQYAADDSTVAERKQLEAELAQKQAELEEMLNDQAYEDAVDNLDDELEAYEKTQQEKIDILEQSCEDTEAVLNVMYAEILNNSENVYDTLTDKAAQYGLSLPGYITQPWIDSQGTVSNYVSVFGSQMDFVKTQLYSGQRQADALAGSLIHAFGVSSGTLQVNLNNVNSNIQNDVYSAANLKSRITQAISSSYNTVPTDVSVNNVKTSLQNASTAADTTRLSIVQTLSSNYNTNPTTNSINAVKLATEATTKSMIALRDSLDQLNGKKLSVDIDVFERKTRVDATIDRINNAIAANGKIPAHATGGIITIDPRNPFNRIAESVGEDTMIAVRNHEGVLTEQQVELFRKVADHLPYMMQYPSVMQQTHLPEHMPAGINAPEVNIHYDNLVTVNGSIDKSFAKEFSGIVDMAVTKTRQSIARDLKMLGWRSDANYKF